MLNIQVDLQGLTQEFFLTKQQNVELAREIVLTLTGSIREKWEEVAKQNLGKTRDEYVRSLIIGDEGVYVGFVKLTNALPNMIEQGADSFDMKDGFSKSPKIKIKKSGGWYLTVPMQWATPGAIGELHSAKMPAKIHEIMKKKKADVSLKLKEIPLEYRAKNIRESLTTKKGEIIPEYKHKHSIYEGLIKKQKVENGRKTHTQYMSFRRISDNSDTNSWQHPGFVAKNLKDKALDRVDIGQEVDKIIDNYLASIGK